MKKTTSLLALVSAGIMTLSNCASQQYFDYSTVNQDTPEFSLTCENLDAQKRLANGLESIFASEMFNPEFASGLHNIRFIITEKSDLPTGGIYNVLKREIHINLNPGEKKIFFEEYPFAHSKDSLEDLFNFYLQFEVMTTLVHEILHHYWHNNLSGEQRREFRNRVLDIVDNQEHLNSSDPFYKNFSDFMSYQKFYEEKKGIFFEHIFYGTEAFAYFLDDELVSKAVVESNPQMLKQEFEEVPRDLLEFYRGCINERAFK